MNEIEEKPFGYLPDGSSTKLFILESGGGIRVAITDYGASLVSLWAPDRSGELKDVILGYDSVEGYMLGRAFHGATIGRYANRIAGGTFSLSGHTFALGRNDANNHLHGGTGGFGHRLWQVKALRQSEITLGYTSQSGEEGYPGNLDVEVTFSLPDTNSLQIDYSARTDQATPVNLTNHAYFNLAGHDAGSILDHLLTLSGTHITPIDENLIPTGEMTDVRDSPFDFRIPHFIGDRIDEDHAQLRRAGGYDHNFVVGKRNGVLSSVAHAVHPTSGRTLLILTTEPGLQFYSGNFLDGSEVGKGGIPYRFRSGFCLETQHFPDSPNQPSFPSTILEPGQVYHSTTIYRLGVEI